MRLEGYDITFTVQKQVPIQDGIYEATMYI